MDKFEFYKELYHKENDRKSEITNSYRIPVVVISALASGAYFLLIHYTFQLTKYLDWIFICLLSFTILCILTSCYYMIRAFNTFKSFDYKGIPPVNMLEDWHKELLKYYKKDKRKTSKEFKKGVTNHFIESIQYNTEINDRKHGFIYKSKQFSAIGLTFLILCFVPYLYNHFSIPQKLEKTEVLDKDYIKELKALNIKIDSLTNSIDKLKIEIMSSKEKTTKKSTPPPAPKVRKYSEGGQLSVPKQKPKSK